MEETKRKLYVERNGFWTEAAMLFMVLAMIFRVIGSIGHWDDMNYLITLVALPVFCGLLFLLCLLCFGKRAFWTTVVPVVIGVVFFIFQIMAVEDNLLKVGLISLCVVIAVLYAMTFSHPGLKWLLALVLLAVFGYLVGIKDLPKLMDPEKTVGFVEGMQELSVLGILLSLLCVSLAMRTSRKAPEEPAEPEELPPEPPAEPEPPVPAVSPAPAETPAAPESPDPAEPPAPADAPAAEEAPAKPKKLSWKEKRKARKEKNEPQPKAEEEEQFSVPIPEPMSEPEYPEDAEPYAPAAGSTWEVSYEEPSYDAEPLPELDPEPDAYPEHHYFPEENFYPGALDEQYPDPVGYDEPSVSPAPDFDGDGEPAPFDPIDYTPVEEVPITRKTPFAEPAEIYPLEEPAEDEPGPTAP